MTILFIITVNLILMLIKWSYRFPLNISIIEARIIIIFSTCTPICLKRKALGIPHSTQL